MATHQWTAIPAGSQEADNVSMSHVEVWTLIMEDRRITVQNLLNRSSTQYFDTCKKNVTHEEAVLQTDFDENYGMISQDESQLAYWSHSQITLFTCSVWLADEVFLACDLSFEEVEKFKYLGATVTNINDTQEEMKRRLNMGNACYYSVEKLLSSSLLSKSLKVRIYKTVILPVVPYGCETWTLTLREEQRLSV
ncbi:hypothetical protein ANN_06604 [Periplaneta americana]|uniref:Uncharacterized protein n=1 Tax=Periplaneta americana TaxID=6978 RepID=A0ABQ8TDZ9_PERAM|nr:hypothetical protein ANN_06604 [Periplaneta americana]